MKTVDVRIRSSARAIDAGLLDELSEPLELEERRVTLVEVEHRRREPEPPKHAHAAYAEHELLSQTVLAVAAVQRVGDGARPVGIALDLRVEEVERYLPDPGEPDADPDRHDGAVVGGELDDRSHRHERQRQPARAVAREALELAVVLVEPLAEVAAPVVEADADERDAELRGRLEMVACEDPEAAGIDRQALVEPELCREIRDEEIVRQLALLPPRPALALDREALLHAAEMHGVLRGQRAAEVVVRELGEERRRVVAEGAESRLSKVGKQRAGAGRPAERKVARNFGERLAQRRSIVDIRHIARP